MPISTRRKIDALTPFAFNGTSDFRLPRGWAHSLATLSLSGTVTLSVATGAAFRARGIPIRSIQLIADGGVTPHVIVGRDALIEAELMEQSPIAAMYTPPSAAVVSTPYAFSAQLPLFLAEPFAGSLAWQYTQLPSWVYTAEVTLRIQWGDNTEMFSGTTTGALTVPTCELTLLSADKWDPSDINAADFSRRFSQTYKSYSEFPVTAGQLLAVDIPRTEDVRNIFIFTEDTNRNFADTIVTRATLEEDNSVQRYANVSWAALCGETSRIYGQTRPVGAAVMEFAEDGNVSSVLQTTKMSSCQLKLTIAANGFVRVYTRRLGPPKR